MMPRTTDTITDVEIRALIAASDESEASWYRKALDRTAASDEQRDAREEAAREWNRRERWLAVKAKREAGQPDAWSPLIRRFDDGSEVAFDATPGGGGWRDHLDGDPIGCGSGLELQALEWKGDEEGDYTRRLATGVYVRYELAWTAAGKVVMLHASYGGYSIAFPATPEMRFRWPRSNR